MIWVGLVRAPTSRYEPGFHISCSYKLNSLVEHKIRSEHISGQQFMGPCYSACTTRVFRSNMTFSLSGAIEPDYLEEDSKELRWSGFSLNLSVSGNGLFVSMMCKYRMLFWFMESLLYFYTVLWKGWKFSACMEEAWETPWGIRGWVLICLSWPPKWVCWN